MCVEMCVWEMGRRALSRSSKGQGGMTKFDAGKAGTTGSCLFTKRTKEIKGEKRRTARAKDLLCFLVVQGVEGGGG